jgi:hypothetical protein
VPRNGPRVPDLRVEIGVPVLGHQVVGAFGRNA